MIRWLVPTVWLLVVWLALWEGITVGIVVAGVAIALGLLVAFRSGGGIERWTLRPIATIRFIGYFIVQFLVANVEVARAVLQPSRVVERQAIIAVPVRTSNPGILAVLTSAVSLTPGTSVVEVHSDPTVLYLHVLAFVSTEETRRSVAELESRLIRALGPGDDGQPPDTPERSVP